MAAPRDEQLDLGPPVARTRLSHSNDRGPVGTLIWQSILSNRELANVQYIGKVADKHAKKFRSSGDATLSGSHSKTKFKGDLFDCLFILLWAGPREIFCSGQLHQQRLTSFALLPRRHRFQTSQTNSVSASALRQKGKLANRCI